jgi:uncharacterized protein YegL
MAGIIPDVSLIDNSDERAPLVLVLDCSGSMEGAPIQMMNEGLKKLADDLKNDAITAKRGRVLVISFCGDDQVDIIGGWQDAMDFEPPELVANGRTPTGAAVHVALAEIEKQKEELRAAGVSYKRPIMMLMSDGEPTDQWESVAAECKAAEAAGKVTVMSIAVGDGANQEVLGQFSTRGSVKLSGLKFNELFIWLSRSVRAVSKAVKGETAQLPATDSWASVGT